MKTWTYVIRGLLIGGLIYTFLTMYYWNAGLEEGLKVNTYMDCAPLPCYPETILQLFVNSQFLITSLVFIIPGTILGFVYSKLKNRGKTSI